jgi:hypothetical protein
MYKYLWVSAKYIVKSIVTCIADMVLNACIVALYEFEVHKCDPRLCKCALMLTLTRALVVAYAVGTDVIRAVEVRCCLHEAAAVTDHNVVVANVADVGVVNAVAVKHVVAAVVISDDVVASVVDVGVVNAVAAKDVVANVAAVIVRDLGMLLL